MTTKLVEIYCCTSCKHFSQFSGYCLLARKIIIIKDMENIPLWCPLPDAGSNQCASVTGDNREENDALEKMTYIKTLENALIDILDGNSRPHDIQYFTGLPDERCEEISKLFATIMSNRRL